MRAGLLGEKLYKGIFARPFYLKDGEKWTKVGAAHRLFFKLDHFTGCRFGLFVYSTRQTGGKAVFTDFKYRYE